MIKRGRNSVVESLPSKQSVRGSSPLVRSILVGLGLLVSSVAWAATSATISLTGSVPLVLAVTTTPTTAASGLDLSTSATNLKLADVQGRTNQPAGFTLSVRSGNMFSGNCTTPCLYSSSTSEFLPITLKRDSTALTFSTDTATYVVRNSRGADNSELLVTFTGNPDLAQATDYAESLLFSIVVN